MTELDILNAARSATANEVNWFGQIITINLAMVVGIYYFLNRAGILLRIFAFAAYLLGMLLYFGEMVLESNLKLQALNSLRATQHLSSLARAYLDINSSWAAETTRVLFNGAMWVLAAGIFYLLFFWRPNRGNS